MSIYYLSIGSNICPQENIPKCIKALKDAFETSHFSSVYETDPIGPSGNQKFWNLTAKIESDLTVAGLTEKLRTIEGKLGRVRQSNKFAPRTIDIDILPQQDYQKLAFIIIPLAEMDPEGMDSESAMSFEKLASLLKDSTKGIRKIKPEEYSR